MQGVSFMRCIEIQYIKIRHEKDLYKLLAEIDLLKTDLATKVGHNFIIVRDQTRLTIRRTLEDPKEFFCAIISTRPEYLADVLATSHTRLAGTVD